MNVKPLVVTKSVREFNVPEYWRNQISYVDRLVIKNYWIESGHEISRKFFLEHEEYTHYIILAEDVIITPSHFDLLINDLYDYDFPVVAGVMNVDFMKEASNLSFRDMRKVVVHSREIYKHPSLKDLLLSKHGFPLIEVTFQGNALVSFRRDVFEKLSLKPYRRYSTPFIRKNYGCPYPYGSMFDLQICNELQDIGIPIIVDLRLMFIHFAFGSSVINYAHKPRSITLIRSDGTSEVLKEEPPYKEAKAEEETTEKKVISKEEWYRIFHGTKKKESDLEKSSEESANSSKDSTTVANHDHSKTADN